MSIFDQGGHDWTGRRAAPMGEAEQEQYVIRMMLRTYDPRMLTSPDGKRVDVNLDAIYKLVQNRR